MYRQYNDSSFIDGDDWIISIIYELMDCKGGMGTSALKLSRDVCFAWTCV